MHFTPRAFQPLSFLFPKKLLELKHEPVAPVYTLELGNLYTKELLDVPPSLRVKHP